MTYYFAYGSNMNSARMLERVGEFSIIGRGVLSDFRLAFNKKAHGKVGEAYANVMPSPGDSVEGIVYQFDEIQKLDKHEGYPNHYDRKLMKISIGGESTEAWVYFAREDRIAEGLLPSKEYLEHLLQGKEYLSEEYFQSLLYVKINLNQNEDEKIRESFIQYYLHQFKLDLSHFFSLIPNESKFHDDIKNKRIYTIQYEQLTPKKGNLGFLSNESKHNFLIALYYCVLIDMVCYTYFKPYYEKFNHITMYPKLIGDCLSACHYHLNPESIFQAVYDRNYSENNTILRRNLSLLKEYYKIEVFQFLNEYLSDINQEEFWSRCISEITNVYKSA
jgi:gamma-glutamylcyclotransferase (GGCT)/AIG2-like uncharacterized protein YtfP